MSLNKQKLIGYLNRINQSHNKNFKIEIKNLFDYLESFAKGNIEYENYLQLRAKWQHWPLDRPTSTPVYYPRWEMPNNEADCKSLSFDLYMTIAYSDSQYEGWEFAETYFHKNDPDYSISLFNNTFFNYLDDVIEEIYNAETTQNITNHIVQQKEFGDSVFIIHGHDEHFKTEVQLLLHRAGVKSIVLHEQPNKGRTIIDKLIEESNKANFAIALLTPDDLLQNGNIRARQNVIWEAGYFLGKLGKSKVLLLIKENVEIPTDLQGIIYETYDRAGAWKMKVAKELHEGGIDIDLKSIVSTI